MALFDVAADKVIKQKVKDWGFFDKTQKEFESIGLFLQNHPLDVYQDSVKLPFSEMADVIVQIKIRSRAERKFAVLQLATTNDMHTIICYESKIIENKQALFVVGCQVILDFIKNDNGIICKNIYSLKKFILKNLGNKIVICVQEIQQIKSLKNVLKRGGNFEIILAVKTDSSAYRQILLGDDFCFELEELILIKKLKY